MQIKISNLKLKNFKGIKNLEINFEGKNANIYGKNASEIKNIQHFIFSKENTFFKKLMRKIPW